MKEVTEEQRKQIKESAANFMRGRAMVLSFKPLSLEDVKEAYLQGVEDVLHLLEE